jgi:hypothetical protein
VEPAKLVVVGETPLRKGVIVTKDEALQKLLELLPALLGEDVVIVPRETLGGILNSLSSLEDEVSGAQSELADAVRNIERAKDYLDSAQSDLDNISDLDSITTDIGAVMSELEELG